MLGTQIKSTSEERYKRGQVLWALWYGLFQSDKSEPIPKQFATRARRMEDLGVPIPAEERPSQAGIDVMYDPYQVFELGLALVLGNNGLNQSVIARLIHAQRATGHLRATYDKIMDANITYGDFNTRYFMTLMLAEFGEVHGLVDASGASIGIRHIEYPMTREYLAEHLPNKLLGDAVIVVELGSIARKTARNLRSAPETKRGRRAG